MNFCFSLLCSLFLAGTALAGPASVFLQVHAESEHKNADTKALEKVHSHWLTVRVTNSSPVKLEGLTLKWKLYAANLQRGSDQILVEKSGEMKIAVEASGNSIDVTTPKVAFAWTPQHAVRSGSSRRAVYKTVPEEGHRYHGYLIQIMNGDTVVAEAVSSEALRKVD